MQSNIASLCNALDKTISPVLDERRGAENFLKNAEKEANFCVSLISIINNRELSLTVLMSASIFLKNFVKKQWKVDSDNDDLICESDRNGLKAHLIDALLTSAGAVQQQLSECIAIIGEADFPNKWPTLLPDIISRMDAHGSSVERVNGILQIAHLVFKRFRYAAASDQLYSEMKLVIGQFGQPLTVVAQHMTGMIFDNLDSAKPMPEMVLLFKAIALIFKIFYSLNCQDLPEFFEDNLEAWMILHRKYLKLDQKLAASVNEASGEIKVIEQVRSQICDNIGLYATKYEEDFAPFLQDFVTDVWEMLLQPSSSDDVMVGNSIHFISSVVAKPQHRHLFESPETLTKLCEMVILPNIQFRASDEELFEDTPEEYLNRDLEGSDSHTRRHSACQLVANLCNAFEGPVIANFSSYINHLLAEYSQGQNQATGDNSSWQQKDAALILITTVSAKGKTQKFGVTETTKLVDIQSFFDTHVLPELTSQHLDKLPVIKADCLRYAITFRNHLNHGSLIQLLSCLPHLMQAKSWVVHTYACYLLDRLFLLADPANPTLYLLSSEHIADAQTLVQSIIHVLSMSISLDNVHAIKALLRTVVVLQAKVLPALEIIISTLVQRLHVVAQNPAKPQFNHFLFETIAFCIYLTCAYEPTAVTSFETALFPFFAEIMQKDISEFLPYMFQLICVLFEQYPVNQLVLNVGTAPGLQLRVNNKPASLVPTSGYMELLPKVLTPAVWTDPQMIPSLSRMIQAYLLYKSQDLMAQAKLQNILGIYQKLIQLKSFDHHAFCILHLTCASVPREQMMPMLKQLFICIFQRLTAAKTDKFMRGLTYFVSQFLLIFTVHDLINLIESIQAGLFAKLVEKVLVPVAKFVIPVPVSSTVPAHQNWRWCSVGLTRLLCDEPQLFGPNCTSVALSKLWPELLVSVLRGLVAGPSRGGQVACEQACRLAANPLFMLEGRLIEVDADRLYSLASSQLLFAPQQLPDYCANIPDPQAFFMQSLAKITSAQPGYLNSVICGCNDQTLVQSFQHLVSQTGVTTF